MDLSRLRRKQHQLFFLLLKRDKMGCLLNSGVEYPPCKRVVVGSNPTGGSEVWQSGRMQRFAKS